MCGMAAALLNTERRWSGVRENDLALVQAVLATPMLPEPRAAQQTAGLTLPSSQHPHSGHSLPSLRPPALGSMRSRKPERSIGIHLLSTKKGELDFDGNDAGEV